MDTSEVLTTEEMSALLPDTAKAESPAGEGRKRIVPYNFRRPDRLSKDQVRSLYLLHDLFAHSLSSSLPLFLRAGSEVNLISVEQQSFSEYQKSLPDPTVIFSVEISPLRGVAAIEFNSSVAFPIIDRMLGGSGMAPKEQRPVTEIEQKILEAFLNVVTDNWREAWKPIIELDMDIVGRETRPQLLQIVAPNEVVVTIVFAVNIGDAKGSLSFCLPVALLEPVIDKFSRAAYSANKTTSPEQTNTLLNKLSIIRFPVAAQLEKTRAAVSDLMALSVGDVLRTNHRVDHPLCISVSNQTKFKGKVAACNGQIVAQITEVKAENNSSAPIQEEESDRALASAN